MNDSYVNIIEAYVKNVISLNLYFKKKFERLLLQCSFITLEKQCKHIYIY